MRYHGPDDPTWVLGYVDSYGAVHARTANYRGNPTHTNEERMSGRPFRWAIISQEFHPVLGCSRLDDEDFYRVVDWLEREGYKHPEEASI